MGGGKLLRQMKYSCHAGTTKWNKNKHRLFAFITKNWRGNPLVSHQVIVQLIGSTTTDTCLQVCCEIDGNLYPKGITVTDQEIQAINITRDNSTASELHHLAKPATTLKRLFPRKP
jgi:hypothetical protein